MDLIHDKAKRSMSEQLPGNIAPARKTSTINAPSATVAMGVRASQQLIDKLTKENFSLKLSITMQSQAEQALRKKAAKAELLDKKIQELERANEAMAQQLRQLTESSAQELAKRDVAIKEAFDVICQLEAKRMTSFLKETTLNHADSTAVPNPAAASPSLPVKPILMPKRPTATSTASLTSSLATSQSSEGSEDPCELLEKMSIVSDFDPRRDYDMEARMGHPVAPSKSPATSPPPPPPQSLPSSPSPSPSASTPGTTRQYPAPRASNAVPAPISKPHPALPVPNTRPQAGIPGASRIARVFGGHRRFGSVA
ncbi:MAG: hypothetical protein Q9218_002699 [Villophora microphyllina]